ncbi:MAG: DUF3857 domain-containing protein [Bacteroidales bacterium]|nr:DUF3857 domain-containing protein [Bacteroidales bacterium]
MKTYISVSALLLILFHQVSAQKAPVVFGKVPAADLQMTSYDLDSTAPALVLCDYGWFDNSSFKFTRLLRIKILRKEGFKYADRKYLTMSDPTIRAITINLEGDEIIKQKLEASEVYSKKISSDYYETSFAMPNVKAGSVIDIEFIYPGLPYLWEFQWMIPVRHSELILKDSQYFEYSKNYFGYIPLDVNESNRWVAVNVPAFKPEPFIDSPDNYLARFEIDIKRITFPGYFRSLTTSWDEISANLLVNSSFPAETTNSLCLTQLVNDLRDSGLTGDELLCAAFEKVKKIKYNGENRLYVSPEGLCSKFKLGSGNSAEVNLSLNQVLNRLGFKAYPVVLSTRDNGMISPFEPSLYKLNYVIVALSTEKGFRLLDATEELMPCTLLPERCINGEGRLVKMTNSMWVPLVSEAKDEKTITYDMILNKDLSLSGKITIDAKDYAAYDIRKSLSHFNSKEEYARHLEKEKPGMTISAISMEGVEDLYAPLKMELTVRIDDAAFQINDEVYLTPLLFEALKENPFPGTERKYPVSYPRKKQHSIKVRITPGEGQLINTIPKSKNGRTKNSSIVFSYNTNKTEDAVEIDYRFSINSLMVFQEQYNEMREVYNQIVVIHSEPIIIISK